MNKYLLNTYSGQVHRVNEVGFGCYNINKWIIIKYNVESEVWTVYHDDNIIETIVKCKPWFNNYLIRSPRPIRFVSRSGDIRYSSVPECLNIIRFVGNSHESSKNTTNKDVLKH